MASASSAGRRRAQRSGERRALWRRRLAEGQHKATAGCGGQIVPVRNGGDAEPPRNQQTHSPLQHKNESVPLQPASLSVRFTVTVLPLWDTANVASSPGLLRLASVKENQLALLTFAGHVTPNK